LIAVCSKRECRLKCRKNGRPSSYSHIGELSRDLEKAKPGVKSKELRDTDVGQSKSKQLASVGINKRTAERYEELAGPREKQAKIKATGWKALWRCRAGETVAE
jgi:hypothetical protein